MSVIEVFNVNGFSVELIQHPYTKLLNQNNFNGQKLFHPIKTKTITETFTVKNRSNKETIKTKSELVYDSIFENNEVENSIKNAQSFEMKHDGSCGLILWDEVKQEYVPYARYDVKRDDKNNTDFKPVPPNSIPCEPKPTNDAATHWPHFVPCHSDHKMYKWHLHAFSLMIQSGKLDGIKRSFTCEYMGKKFNYKKSDGVNEDAVIVPHGLVSLNIPVELRTVDGFKQILEKLSFIEGLIIHGRNGIVWKIRRDMFHNGSKRMDWPSNSDKQISELVIAK